MSRMTKKLIFQQKHHFLYKKIIFVKKDNKKYLKNIRTYAGQKFPYPYTYVYSRFAKFRGSLS